jgi:glycosyltransferase involved in cell wall biosynthesis
VVTACKAPVPRMLNLHHVAFAGACLPSRIDLPCTIMNSLPGVTATRSVAQHVLPGIRPGEMRVAVLQRQKVTDRTAFLATFGGLVRKGWVLVAEWDDDPDLLPADARADWLRNPWLSVSAVHGCQVSTPHLAGLFGRHNPEIAVFENALAEIPVRPEKRSDRIRIVYGALNRDGVAALVQPAIDRVAAGDPRVEVVIVHDRAVFDALDTPRKRFVPVMPYDDYLGLLASAHVALLPLVGHTPELGKSDLKFLESASRGAAVIASPAIYAGSVRDGETGFIARTAAEWADRLALLVADAGLRERLAEAAWRYVAAERLIGRQVARREAWYRSLWERREALTRDLLRRHPEMTG